MSSEIRDLANGAWDKGAQAMRAQILLELNTDETFQRDDNSEQFERGYLHAMSIVRHATAPRLQKATE